MHNKCLGRIEHGLENMGYVRSKTGFSYCILLGSEIIEHAFSGELNTHKIPLFIL